MIVRPLPNHFFEQWHYRRIVCIGDSVVKVSGTKSLVNLALYFQHYTISPVA
jgi:hypothetical protein